MSELTFDFTGTDIGPWAELEAAKLFFAQNPGVHFGPGATFSEPMNPVDDLAYFGLTTAVRSNVTPVTTLGTGSPFANQDINGILIGRAWNTTSLTFSFPTASSQYGTSQGTGVGQYNDPAPFNGLQVLTNAQKDVVRYALNLITQYTGLTFTEITETDSTHATLRFAGSSAPSTSYAYYPFASSTAGDVFFGNIKNAAWTKAGYAFDTVLHEIGHALGLKHGHEANATFGTLPSAHNSTEWSLMTYYAYVGTPNDYYSNFEGSGNQTYMANDIAALQYLYGANFNINNTATTYTFSTTTGEMFINGVGQGASSANKIYQSIWDGGGTDTYDVANYSTNQLIDLRPGEWSTFSAMQIADLDQGNAGAHLAHGNILNAHLSNNNTASLIENANAGSGNDIIIGNQAFNTLNGNGGNDFIATGVGIDISSGGDGNDTIVNGVASLSGMSVTISSYDTNSDFISGNAGNDSLVGGNGGDVLAGGAGDDVIDGGTGRDYASFSGATGGVYVSLAVSGAQAVGGGEGSDTLIAIESLVGSGYNDTLIGNTEANLLHGGSGVDFLGGGAGNDTLTGDGGNDNLDGGIGTDVVTLGGTHADVLIHSYAVGGIIYTDVLDQVGNQARDTMVNVETLGFFTTFFGIVGIQHNLLSRMDAQRFDDVLVRHATTGQIAFVDMSGQATTTQGVVRAVTGALPAGWTAVGSGDLDGDSRAETIVQSNTGGLFYVNTASGSAAWGTISSGLPTEWQVVGLGDMTSDGSLDVVIRSSVSGNIMYAEMNGTTFSGWGNVFNMGTAWRAVDVGDYDRDGDSDVLVQEIATGTTYFVQMQGGAFSGWGLVTGSPGSQWVAKEAADFNADGYFDVVFENSSTDQIWYVNMANGVNSGWGTLVTAVGWDVKATGDYDNDGYADILVQNPTNGNMFFIDIDNGAMVGWGNVRNNIGTDWIAV